MGNSGLRTLLFFPGSQPSEAARNYIALGEKMGIDKRYKCRKRKPWWQVPLPQTPDVFISYMNAFGPNICANDAGVPYLNSCHGITFHPGLREKGMAVLPMAAFNSASLLSAELVGRSYGGGIQKLEPREAARMLVPSPKAIDAVRDELVAMQDRVDGLLSERRFEDALAEVDKVFLALAFGLSEHETSVLVSSRESLTRRRVERSKGV